MKLKHILITIALLMAGNSLPAQSQKQLFDDGWTFTRNGKSTLVNLPHDWDIYEGPNPKTGATGTGGGWFQGGKGEYRKTFATPKGELVKIHFEGVYQKAEVFVNGKKAGQHAYGYTPFTVDVTPFLVKKGKNELLVKVNNSEQPNCRWYSGSGIYRHVWLQTMPKVHVAENGIYVTTPKVSPQEATVRVEVTVQNESDKPQQAHIEYQKEEQTIDLKAGESRQAVFTFTFQNPKLWSPCDFGLIWSYLTVNGVKSSFEYGIRSISFDAEKGFLLNGEAMKINGACMHHDNGILGAMAFDAAEERKVQLMKDAGFNLIRTSHNPPSEAFLRACDQLGMLVIDESFDGWRQSKTPHDYSTLIDSCYEEDIRAMVMRDRNHPCVIAWSIGNEVMERKDIRVVTTARQLKQAIMKYDTTRPVTEALCSWDRDWEIYDPHAEVLDIVGYNYMIHKHKSDHLRDPQRIMWQTESYPRDAFRNWAVVKDHPYIIGDIVWTGLDYLGESGIGKYYYEGQEKPGESYVNGGQPEWHGAYCGDVDVTGWRKPISHYRQILWTNPGHRWIIPDSLYMAVREPDGYKGTIKETSWSVWPTWESWTWPGWEGKDIQVEVYTRQPEVKLFLNDRLVGTKTVDRSTEFKAVFTIPYSPGKLRAEAGGKSVRLATAGVPHHLSITSEENLHFLQYDGQDLAFFILEVRDANGNIVPDAEVPCEVNVKGDAQLLAAASANMKDPEPTTSPKFTTWKGRALIVARTLKKGSKGSFSLKVTSSGLPRCIYNVKE